MEREALVQKLAQSFEDKEADLENLLTHSNKVYKRTSKVIVIVLVAMVFFLAINLYLIHVFDKNVSQMANSMQTMSKNMTLVTEDVQHMSSSLSRISLNTQLLPPVTEKMTEINNNIEHLNLTFGDVQKNVRAITPDVQKINGSLHNMAVRFDRVNHNMGKIVNNVNQMSRTLP